MITTSTDLIESLRDEEETSAWTEFCARYRPLLLAFARRLGLREHEAHDAAQETFVACWKAIQNGAYNAERGRLRSWISGIAANKIADIYRRRPREGQVPAESSTTGLIAQIPDQNTIAQAWEVEEARAIVEQSLQLARSELEPTTVEAFELVTLKEWSAARVAEHLGMSRNAVYQAKTRVLTRLRELHEYLETNW
jgi:RNA polymerase sigma-70 factor (ECF subfamily)